MQSASYPSGRTAGYTYDAAGNRESYNNNGTNITYAANSMNEYTQAGGVTLLYDADGNLTNRTDSSGTTRYQYDAEDHLISVTTPDLQTVQYAYNGLGQRMTATTAGGTQHFLYDPELSQLAAVYDQSGNVIARYNQGIGLLSSSDASGNSVYYDYDSLGNTRELVDAAGNVANRYDYDAYGGVVSSVESVSNLFQFVGRYGVMKDTAQLYFMRHRFFSPELGRFITEDFSHENGGLNLLRFMGNNPVNHIDPFGLEDPMISPKSSRGETYNRGPVNVGSLDINVTTATSVADTADIIVTDNGAHLAGGEVVYGEGLGGPAMLSPSTTSEGRYVGISHAVPDGTVSISIPDPGQSRKDSIKYAKTKMEYIFINVEPYMGSPGLVITRNYVSPNMTTSLSISYVFWSDELFSLVPNRHPLIDFQTHPLPYLQQPSYFYEDEDDESDEVALPGDPNDKTGPLGFGPNALISAGQPIPYTITFVNASSNTAPAHVISISDQLDPNLDARTVRLKEIVFGTNSVAIPPNRSFIQTNFIINTVDGPVEANVLAGVDVQSRRLFWTLNAIDPATGQTPSDPLLGLLPPDDTNHVGIGEGRVSYTVTPLAGTVSRTIITNTATITFDINPSITTPAVTNTLDAGTPESTLTLTTNLQSGTNFVVSWAGSDVGGESGVAGYDIYVSVDGGPFQIWLANTTLTSAPYNGLAGHSYSFYSVAHDNAGNVQAGAPVTRSVYLSTNLPPNLASITNVVISPEESVEVDVQGSDPNGDQLTYSLMGGLNGMTINPANGTVTWQATRAYASTTNLVTIVVTDNGVPPLSTNQSFTITVLDYLELTLGNTNLYAGQSSAIPVYLASSDGVTNLVFNLRVPETLFTNWTITPVGSQIASATGSGSVDESGDLVEHTAKPGVARDATGFVAEFHGGYEPAVRIYSTDTHATHRSETGCHTI